MQLMLTDLIQFSGSREPPSGGSILSYIHSLAHPINAHWPAIFASNTLSSQHNGDSCHFRSYTFCLLADIWFKMRILGPFLPFLHENKKLYFT